jgi:3-oxoacyl-[acyl-carrier protein] reductase
MKLTFSGHRVLVLGGTCDLAISLASELIAEGLHPILTWRSEEGRQHTQASLLGCEGQYETAYLDFAERGSMDSLFLQLNDELDYLVDFAHGDMESLICSSVPDNIHDYFSANISFRAQLLRKAGRVMLRKRRGRLVFVSSAAACKPNPGQGFYAAAKLAAEALYRNLGLELASRGVTTVTLRPGYIDSGRGRDYIRTHHEELTRTVPLMRALTGKEAAEAILFFLSDNAAAFNATEISMDGGLTAGKT